MGDDSTERIVVGTTTGYDDLYEVKGSKGWSYICNSEHLVSYKFRGNCTGTCTNYQKKEVKAKIGIYCRNTKKSHSVIYKTGVEFAHKDIKIDPYILGLWIADGTKTNGSPNFYNK